MKIVSVVGARPNLMKIAPLMKAFARRPQIQSLLVHTGQHYDPNMSDLFFRQLGIPEPDINLQVGSASHAVQTAEIMKAFEPILEEHRPDAILVVGDVNSTIACSLVASKLGITVIHVEAGLRSFDRGMPEEINRVLTDSISDLLFCTERSGVENLKREGVDPSKIHLVGNVMIDTLKEHQSAAEKSEILSDLGLVDERYAVVTMHRPSNVDDATILGGVLQVLEVVGRELSIVFPAHPRTRQKLNEFGLADRFARLPNLCELEPVGYLDFLKLMSGATVVLTDSGGVQEETTILGVPCLTLRENTERPITVELGSNQLVGTDPETITDAFHQIMRGGRPPSQIPPLWDGGAAERIADILVSQL